MDKTKSSVLAELYLAEASQMRAFARRRIRDAEEADDLVSEAFRILSERSDFSQIQNPAAFLMTVVHRHINSHLRNQYRRKHLSLEEAGSEIPSSPDIADDYEMLERESLVTESLENIHSARQKRALSLYSLNYKAGEIAELESAAGAPTTSHQVSCVLQGAFANLKTQLRRRGVVSGFIPAPWLIGLRARVGGYSQALGGQLRWVDHRAALQVIVMASLAGVINVPSSPEASLPAPPPAPGSATNFPPVANLNSKSSALVLEAASVSSVLPGRPAEGSNVRASTLGVVALSGIAEGSFGSRPPSTPDYATRKPDIDLPVQSQPQADMTHTEGKSSADAEYPGEYKSSTSVDIATSYTEKPAPPFQDQMKNIADRPDSIPRPECGGPALVCKGREDKDGSRAA